MQLIPQANRILSGISDAQIFVTNLPTISGLSQFGGIDMYLQARAGQGRAQLNEAQGLLLGAAGKSPSLYGIRPNSLPDAPQLQVSVDRVQAQTMGLSLTDVYNALQLQLAPVYVDQLNYQGRVKRVFLQADAPYRMGFDTLQHLQTPSGISNADTGAASTASNATNTSGYSTLVDPSASNTWSLYRAW